MPDPNQSNGIEKKTIRAACVNCHDRKVKCDAHKRGFPCSNCIAFKRQNCRKHEKKKRSFVRPSNGFVPIRRRSPDHTASVQAASSDGSRPGPPVFPGIRTNDRPLTTEYESLAHQNLVEFMDQNDIRRHSIQRGVRITYVGKDVSNINFLVRQRDGGDETIHHVPTDEIARQFIHHEPERMPREAFMLPEQSLADELVEAYFKHVNPGCPIVDEEVFMAQYRSQDPSDPPSLLVLQAILLVGAHVSCERSDRDKLKAAFFRRAKMLFDARLEKNRDIVVQAALLLTWHSDGIEDIGANAWFWVGIAARTATGLGMHRDGGSSKLVYRDMRTWRRIWWILVQFDVTVSLSYGRPQAINLDECDVQALKASDFEGCGPNVQIDYVIKRTELCILISKVLRERFGLRVSQEDRMAALMNADESLANWCLTLPQPLQMASSEMTLWSASLHLTYNNFLILLHRPHPKSYRQPQDYGPNDSDICSVSAITIANIFEDLRTKDRIKYLWISDINALFTAMLQVSVELRFSNPILAINALRRFDSTLLSLRELAEYWVNADSILRIFEESSHIQHGIRLGKEIRNPELSPHMEGTKETNASTVGEEQASASLGAERNQEKSDLDILAEAAHASSDLGGAATQDTQGDASLLPGLFPSNDYLSEDFLPPTDISSLGNEWREIYWQEPGISESFGDGFWGW